MIDRGIRSAAARTATEEQALLTIQDAYRRGREDQMADDRQVDDKALTAALVAGVIAGVLIGAAGTLLAVVAVTPR